MTEVAPEEQITTPAPTEKLPRKQLVRQLVVTAAAFVLAFIAGAIVMVLADQDVLSRYSYFFARPGDALGASWEKVSSAYGALLSGSVMGWRALAETTAQAAPLICAGLGVGLAFRVGLFNIGGQGQAIWGAIIGGWIGFSVTGLPMALHIPLALLCAMAGGAVWGGIAGFLKAKAGAHEVIVTIMLNWIAIKMLLVLLTSPVLQAPGRRDPIAPILEWSATFPRIAGTRLHLGFLIALVAAFVIWWILERTTLGFRLRAVGHNPHAAETAGMNVSRLTIIAMAVAGALGGLAGAQMAMAPTMLTGYPTAVSVGIVGTVGFDAITVALLGRSKPVGVVLAGLLFGALKAGGLRMQAVAGTPQELIFLIQALIVLFVAAPAFVQWAIPFLRTSKPKSKAKAVAA